MRKMIKWKPFYAIPGQEKIIRDILKEKEKIEKPIILNEEEIDLALKESLKENKEITIKYFNHGFIQTNTGKISKINLIEKYLKINNKRIYFKNILKIM